MLASHHSIPVLVGGQLEGSIGLELPPAGPAVTVRLELDHTSCQRLSLVSDLPLDRDQGGW